MQPADLQTEVLYVVGGLYGNRFALETVLALAQREVGPVSLVFNGDFHWFDVDAESFVAIQNEVARHRCLRGNVETELAMGTPDAGCGCGYPDWVDDTAVRFSNAIMARLGETGRTFPEQCAELAALPMWLVAEVGGVRVGIVHGDAESLAGWNFSYELLEETAASGMLQRHFEEAEVRIFASTHTGLAVCRMFDFPQGRCVVVNNGSSGIPNFRDTHFGIVTRVSTTPSDAGRALYATRVAGVCVEAIPVHYDHEAWLAAFQSNWPAASPAYRSYMSRLRGGLEHTVERARPRGAGDR